MPTIVTRGTKKTWIKKLLATPEIFSRESHMLSLESALDRLNEGLPMTATSKIILAIYKPLIIEERNRKIGEAKALKRAVKADHRTRPKSNATKLKIAESMRRKHAERKAAREHSLSV